LKDLNLRVSSVDDVDLSRKDPDFESQRSTTPVRVREFNESWKRLLPRFDEYRANLQPLRDHTEFKYCCIRAMDACEDEMVLGKQQQIELGSAIRRTFGPCRSLTWEILKIRVSLMRTRLVMGSLVRTSSEQVSLSGGNVPRLESFRGCKSSR
jgi:hypothetical protein